MICLPKPIMTRYGALITACLSWTQSFFKTKKTSGQPLDSSLRTQKARCLHETPILRSLHNPADECGHGAYLPVLRGCLPSTRHALFLRRRSVRRIRQRADAEHGGHAMNDNERFYPVVQTPVGKVLLIGSTMTVERERELFGKKVLPNEHR